MLRKKKQKISKTCMCKMNVGVMNKIKVTKGNRKLRNCKEEDIGLRFQRPEGGERAWEV